MSVESNNETPLAVSNVIEMTSSIVAAYVSNNSVESADLPVIITSVHDTMMGLQVKGVAARTQTPAVSIKKSISDDYLICLEDGEKFKSLRRHLRSKYDMSPEEYREKWGLGAEYPMVAPSYARQRSELAKKMGLGQNKKTSN